MMKKRKKYLCIYVQQILKDCWTGKNIRLVAANVFKARFGNRKRFKRLTVGH